MTLTTMLLPPGDYLIIDPCYILSEPRMMALFDTVWGESPDVLSTDPQTGALFAWTSTARGDGVYADNHGHQYGVDSGTLACLPLAMLDAAVLASRPLHDHSIGQVCCGRFVTFAMPSPCCACDEAGIIRFGHITIDTGPPWDLPMARRL